MFLCPDGHSAARTPCGRKPSRNHLQQNTISEWVKHRAKLVYYYLYLKDWGGWTHTCAIITSFSLVVDVRGEDRGFYLPTSRGRQDRVISNAFCNHQSPMAASSWDDTLYQPAERKSSQRGCRDFYRNAPSLNIWVWGTMQHPRHWSRKYISSLFSVVKIMSPLSFVSVCHSFSHKVSLQTFSVAPRRWHPFISAGTALWPVTQQQAY